MIDIERSDKPLSVRVEPRLFSGLRVGETLPISVIGTYARNVEIDLHESTRTTYVSRDLAVAKVSADGWVTATGSGETEILVNGTIRIPVSVMAPITLDTRSVSLKASQKTQFVARVADSANPDIMWSLYPPLGSIDDNGVYTAPSSLSANETVTLTVSSVADRTKSVTASIHLIAAASVTVYPEWSVLYGGQQQQFEAEMINAGRAGVKWSIEGRGSLDGSGLYTAPATIASLESVTIKATSVSKPSLFGVRKFYISAQPFKLLAQSPSVTVTQGKSNGISITELAVDNFPHEVDFSVTGLPPRVRASFNRPTLIGTGSTTLTLAANADAQPGSYTITVTGKDTVYEPLSQSVNFTLFIRAAQ